MNRTTIFQNIILIVFLSSIALILVAAFNFRTISGEIDSINTINNDSLASVVSLAETRQTFTEARLVVLNHILNTDASAMSDMDKRFDEKEKQVLSELKSYEKMLSNEEDRKMWANDIKDMNDYFEFVKKEILPLSRNNQNEAARDLASNQGSALGNKVLENLDTHVEFNKNLAEKTVENSLEKAEEGKNTALIVIAVALSVIGVIGGKLARQIRTRLNVLRDYITNVNQTLNFTKRIDVTREDELGLTTHAFNQLLDRLQNNLKMIASNAQSVVAAADKLASTSTQVATASHQQSEAAVGMAASIEEMTVSITHIGDRALEANSISRESGQLAHQGEEVISQTANYIQNISETVHRASNQIHELEDNSQQIANVIAVIKEVAEQTNLLALNAAIEAARAGEQGRGFAVVADEVRKLAERTSVSTQEIAHTIDTMRASAANAVTSMQEVVTKVGQGVEKANQANISIQKIGQGSRHAVEMVEEITVAIREQSVATNNISVQVERIAQMSEESNAAAKDSAKAAHDLDHLAMNMNSIVAAYTL